MPSDDVDRERVIKFNPPLKASMVKLYNARKTEAVTMLKVDLILLL